MRPLFILVLAGVVVAAGLQLAAGLRQPNSRKATVKVAAGAGAIAVLFPVLVVTALMGA